MPSSQIDLLLRAVGRRLAELRTAAGLTQQELAEQAGVSLRYIQKIEAGSENMTLRSLAQFAELLGVSLVDVLQMPASIHPKKPGRPKRVTLPSGKQTPGSGTTT